MDKRSKVTNINFIKIYHAPYVIPKHRYWTGLLLITRAILYLVAAVNVSNDPIITMIVALSCILALKGSRVYRKWPVDILETLFYLNVLLFTAFTWYCLGECRSRKAAAYTSVSITFIALLFIILYHVYTYTSVFSKIKNTRQYKAIQQVTVTLTYSKQH